MSARVKSYLDFMDWLRANHPDILKNYHNNFNVPKKVDEAISVNNKFNISHEELEMLNKVVRSYYEQEKAVPVASHKEVKHA